MNTPRACHSGAPIGRRNRVVVVWPMPCLLPGALGSGSLHTAAFALDLGKPVLAVPGPINSSLSAGTNQLIKNRGGGSYQH